MAAVVEIVGIYGPEPGTITPLTTQRYCTNNQRDPGLSYPNNVPAAGPTNRSYWIHPGDRSRGRTPSSSPTGDGSDFNHSVRLGAWC